MVNRLRKSASKYRQEKVETLKTFPIVRVTVSHGNVTREHVAWQ